MNCCQLCGKKLKKIGNDWENRKYHKSCYKRMGEILYVKSIMEKLEKEHKESKDICYSDTDSEIDMSYTQYDERINKIYSIR